MRELVFIALFAALIGIAAWMAIPAAVSFTMQTFAVFSAVGLIGTKCAVGATTVYVLLGAIGLPVFTGFRGGMGILFAVNGGYIVGFIFAALVSGLLIKLCGYSMPSLIFSMSMGMIACYIFGSLWFCLLHKASIATAFVSGVLPYIPFDMIKIVLAAVVTRRMYKMKRQVKPNTKRYAASYENK